MLFAKDLFYIRVFRDKIEIRNVNTDQEIRYTPAQTFSNTRLLIADFEVFEQELMQALKEIEQKKIINRSPKFVFQPVDESSADYSPVEKRVFRDSCAHVGASEVYLYYGKDKLTNQQIRDLMKGKFVDAQFEN